MQRDEPLTEREREVIELMARGLTNGQIADELGITFATAKAHVSDIIGRLGVTSCEEAVAAWRSQQSAPARIRRSFATMFGLPALGLGTAVFGAIVVGAFLGSRSLPADDAHDAGVRPLVVNLADLPVDLPERYMVDGLGADAFGRPFPIWLVHHEDGTVSAFFGRDPHSNCLVEWEPDLAPLEPLSGTTTPIGPRGAFRADCSGWRFARDDGAAIYGASYRGLDVYPATVDAGKVTVRFDSVTLGLCIAGRERTDYYGCSKPGEPVVRDFPPPPMIPHWGEHPTPATSAAPATP